MELKINVTDSQILFLKNKGNECFKSKEYDKAIEHYSGAISYRKTNPILFSNRAICYINLRRYYEAIEDCNKAIELDPKFVKAYYRRATAYKELSRFELALKDFEKALELDSETPQTKKECDKIREILEKDTRIDLPVLNKPQKFKSQGPVKVFELNGQPSGSKTY